MAGKPINLQDIEKLELNKIDKSQIKNTLTETEIGNVLDATQGKVLNDKISVLENRTYWTVQDVNSKFTANTPLYTIIQAMNNGSVLHCGIVASDTSIYPTTHGMLYIYKRNNEWVDIKFTKLGTQANATKWVTSIKDKSTGELHPWILVATTTDTTALDNKINVLSKRNYYTLSDFGKVDKFKTLDECVDAMGSFGSAYLDVALCFSDTSIFPSANGVLIVEKSNLNRTILKYSTSVVNPKDSTFYESFYRFASVPSYSWQPIATTTKTDILFPYASGYSDYNSSYGTLLSKNTLNEVILNIYAKPTSGTFGASTVKIGTLPVGYRPKKNMEINARTSSGVGTLTLYTNGAVNVTMASGTSNYISGTFVYDAQ